MGVTQWCVYGKRHHYWQYFEDEVRAKAIRSVNDAANERVENEIIKMQDELRKDHDKDIAEARAKVLRWAAEKVREWQVMARAEGCAHLDHLNQAIEQGTDSPIVRFPPNSPTKPTIMTHIPLDGRGYPRDWICSSCGSVYSPSTPQCVRCPLKYEIEGEYSFTIKRDEGGYVAELRAPRFEATWTQGKSEAEIFDMISDAFQTALDIPSTWWNRLLWRCMVYKK